MTTEGYTAWERKVSDYLHQLKSELDENETARSLYNGFYVWDSKFIERPKIMFIGINPGNGNPNNDGSIVTAPLAMMSYNEFLDGENPTYTLARETVDIFKELGYSEQEIHELFENETVKTNFYFIITSNQSMINNCLGAIGKQDEFDMFSRNRIKELMDIINPKYVICEGKSVFQKLQSFYDIQESKWLGDSGLLRIKNSDRIIFGYSRRPLKQNNIKDVHGFAEMVKPYLAKGIL
jgi:hypothetical protein